VVALIAYGNTKCSTVTAF